MGEWKTVLAERSRDVWSWSKSRTAMMMKFKMGSRPFA
jgi:hypothetical protein